MYIANILIFRCHDGKFREKILFIIVIIITNKASRKSDFYRPTSLDCL